MSACSRHRSTRAAPTSRGPAPATLDRPGTRQGAECLPLRRLLLGPRRRHRRAPTRRLEVRNPRRLGRHRGPARQHHHARGTHHRARRRTGRGMARTTSFSRIASRTTRSSSPSSARTPRYEHGPMGAMRAAACRPRRAKTCARPCTACSNGCVPNGPSWRWRLASGHVGRLHGVRTEILATRQRAL